MDPGGTGGHPVPLSLPSPSWDNPEAEILSHQLAGVRVGRPEDPELRGALIFVSDT